MLYANPSTFDVVDKNASVILAVTLLPAVVLPALHLEHDDLAVAVMLYHGAGYTGTIHDRAADFDVSSLAHEENAVKIHLRPYIGSELFHLDDVTLVDAILLTACFYNCCLLYTSPSPRDRS